MTTRTIQWTLTTGKLATVTVEAQTRRVIGTDDWIGEISKPCAELTVTGHVEGMGILGYSLDSYPRNAPAGVVATIGCLGIKVEQYKQIKAAMAECEQDPEYQAYVAAERRAAKLDAEYAKHVSAVEDMMTCGGKTY